MEDYSPVASYFADRVTWSDINDVPLMAFRVASKLSVMHLALLNLRISQELRFRVRLKFTLSQLQELYEIVLNEKNLTKETLEKR